MPRFERVEGYSDLYRSKISGMLYYREYNPKLGETYKTSKSRDVAIALSRKSSIMQSIDIGRIARQLLKDRRIVGYFYVVLLEPKLAPTRIKLGFTRDVDRRLSQFRICCPYAELLADWPIDVTEEPKLISALTKKEWALTSEVFEVPSVSDLIAEVPEAIRFLRMGT